MSLDQVQKHREDLEDLAERDDLRTSKYAQGLLKIIDEIEGGDN